MDAADLDLRVRTHTGCIPPHLVERLVELGHADEVEFQARHGEWFCARERAGLLASQDRQAEALSLLAPYLATGWWPAAMATAELLEGWGRIDEAIELTRPHVRAGDRPALEFTGRLLARHGRGDEAFALFKPHIADWFLAMPLVDVVASAGGETGAVRDAAGAGLDAVGAGWDAESAGVDGEGARPSRPTPSICSPRSATARAASTTRSPAVYAGDHFRRRPTWS